jgi:hypothetical protein
LAAGQFGRVTLGHEGTVDGVGVMMMTSDDLEELDGSIPLAIGAVEDGARLLLDMVGGEPGHLFLYTVLLLAV